MVEANLNKANCNTLKFQDLGLPFSEVILEEIFLLPPRFLGGKPFPPEATIADLIEHSGLKTDEVLRQLRFLMKIAPEVSLSAEQFQALCADPQHPAVVVDLRLADECDPSAPSPWQPLEPATFAALFDQCRTQQRPLILLSGDGRQAFSGALYLRPLYAKSFSISAAVLR